jgi:hypothetical protein
MIDDENQNAAPGLVGEVEVGTEEKTGGSLPEGGEEKDVREGSGKSDEAMGLNDAAGPEEIAGERWQNERQAAADGGARVSEAVGPKRIERPGNPAGEREGAEKKAMAGVISRIERLENWVKTNRLG